MSELADQPELQGVATTLATWLGTTADAVSAELGEPALQSLLQKMVLPPSPPFRARKLLGPILNALPDPIRYRAGNLAKRARRSPLPRGEDVQDCAFVRAWQRLRGKLGADGFDWAGRSCAVCLTHDVDYRAGYRFVREVAKMEEERGLRSTFNFVVRGSYAIEPGLVQGLQERGHEIGLHGYRHDPALGFRSREQIQGELERAVAEMPVPVHGFRAPALSGSAELLAALGELRFRYDASLRLLGGDYGRVELCFPYRYPGTGLWEVPLALADDVLFRDHRLDAEPALEVSKTIIQQVAAVRGVAVLNVHPYLVRHAAPFYQMLLEWLMQDGQFLVAPVASMLDVLDPCATRRGGDEAMDGGP